MWRRGSGEEEEEEVEKIPDLKFYVLDSMLLFIFLSIHINYMQSCN